MVREEPDVVVERADRLRQVLVRWGDHVAQPKAPPDRLPRPVVMQMRQPGRVDVQHVVVDLVDQFRALPDETFQHPGAFLPGGTLEDEHIEALRVLRAGHRTTGWKDTGDVM